VAREPTWQFFDNYRYLAYARGLAAGDGYVELLTGQPTAYYPPGYPLFLGAITLLAEHNPLSDNVPRIAGYVQAVLGTLTIGMSALIARRIAGPVAGIVAACVFALYPNLVFHTGVLMSETLYIFLFAAFLTILLWRPWPEGLSGRRVLAASVVLGLAILVRPISIVIVPALFLVWWWDQRDWRVALKWFGLAVAGVAICVLPWTVRNYVRMDGFVPLSTNTGDNLCMGHKPTATGAFNLDPYVDPCQTEDGVQFGSASELRNDKIKTRRALKFIKEDPGREPWLVWRRFYFMYVRDGDHDGALVAENFRYQTWLSREAERRLFRVADITYWVVAAVGVVGLVRLALSRRGEAWALFVSIVGTAIVPLGLFGDSRFKVPVMALLIVAAGCAVVPRWPPGRRRGDPAAGRGTTARDDEAGEPPAVDGASPTTLAT